MREWRTRSRETHPPDLPFEGPGLDRALSLAKPSEIPRTGTLFNQTRCKTTDKNDDNHESDVRTLVLYMIMILVEPDQLFSECFVPLYV